jgi:hypothetical protein
VGATRNGNYLAVLRGAHSERVVHSLAAELAEWLTSEHPDLAAPRYRFAVGRLARAEAVASGGEFGVIRRTHGKGSPQARSI